ncbi:hypothetical protein SL985_27655 [Klebsiella pneumoniae]
MPASAISQQRILSRCSNRINRLRWSLPELSTGDVGNDLLSTDYFMGRHFKTGNAKCRYGTMADADIAIGDMAIYH